jgi:hypothetical protein
MGKKSGLIEKIVGQATPSAKVAVEETPVQVETPQVQNQDTGYPSRDFKHRFNG